MFVNILLLTLLVLFSFATHINSYIYQLDIVFSLTSIFIFIILLKQIIDFKKNKGSMLGLLYLFSSSIPFLLLSISLEVRKGDMTQSLFLPMTILYFHIFYLKYGSIKKTFKNLNLHFYVFIFLGFLFFIMITFLYSVPIAYQKMLYLATFPVALLLIPSYYYGLAPTFAEVMKAREAKEAKKADLEGEAVTNPNPIEGRL